GQPRRGLPGAACRRTLGPPPPPPSALLGGGVVPPSAKLVAGAAVASAPTASSAANARLTLVFFFDICLTSSRAARVERRANGAHMGGQSAANAREEDARAYVPRISAVASLRAPRNARQRRVRWSQRLSSSLPPPGV